MTWLSEIVAAGEEGKRPRASGPHAMRVLRGALAADARTAALTVEIADRSSVEDGSTSKAAEIRRPRRLTIEERLEFARQEGFEDGFREGTASAEHAAEAAEALLTQQATDAFARAAEAIVTGKISALLVVQKEVAELAFELTRALVAHELAAATSPGIDAVARALELSSPEAALVVRLHPDEVVDAADLRPLAPECAITVVADPTVERGGCVMTAGPTRIDAQIQPALDRVRQILLDERMSPTQTIDVMESS